MAMEDNIKQTNFRVDQQTAEEFRTFCKDNGFSQAQGFDYLIELVELEKAKSVVSSRATEIEDFEQHSKALVAAFLRSIEMNENAEANYTNCTKIKKLQYQRDIFSFQSYIYV